jgi:two-component system, LytTR family, response regulator
VQKATKELEEHTDEKPTLSVDDDDYIFVKTESKGKLLKINLDEIDYIEGMKNYVAIYCGGKKTLVYTSMKDLEERLSKKQFIRVHKSFIIPIAKITGIEGNILRLKNVTAEILIGDNYKADLMEIIRNKMIQ